MSGGHVQLADCDTGFVIFRECAVIFSDGFESGDTAAWSGIARAAITSVADVLGPRDNL